VSGHRHALPRFTPGERTPGTHCTRGWVGSRAGLDSVVREKISCLCRGSNFDRPVQSAARHYTNCYTCSAVPIKRTFSLCAKVPRLIICFNLILFLFSAFLLVLLYVVIQWLTLGWVVLREIVCEMHVAQLLQTVSSLTAEHTNSTFFANCRTHQLFLR
jgi:hypothetical protein